MITILKLKLQLKRYDIITKLFINSDDKGKPTAARVKKEYKKAMRYRYEPYEKQVEMVLTNLTDNQREALHKLSKENKEYMKKYRKDREQLEKIIKSLLAMKGDVSEVLFPLIDMKSRLEAEKEKNLYKMKLENQAYCSC